MSEAITKASAGKAPKPVRTKAADPAKDMIAARKGDKEACERLFALWEEIDLVEMACDNLTNSTQNVLEMRYGKDLVMKEVYQRKMMRLRKELTGPNASPLETMLAERIVLCWEHVGMVERQYARALQDSMSLDKAEYYQRSLDRAQKRYLSAIKMLAIVRRLQIPAMQVNIGEKQINIVNNVPQRNMQSASMGGETPPEM